MATDKALSWVGVLTSTVGTGDYACGATLSGSPAGPWRAFSAAYLDGDTLPYVCFDSLRFERGRGRYNAGANTITRVLIIENHLGTTAPITWPGGGGTRNLFVDSGSGAVARSALGLGSAALLDAGTAAGQAVVLDGTAHIPTSLYVTLPHTHASLVSGIAWAGGASSSILKWASAGVLSAADLGNSVTALWPLWAKGSDGVYYTFGEVPFAGVVAGARYYLGVAGAISTTFSNGSTDVPDGTHTMVIVGYGAAAGVLYFNPSHPFAGLLSTGSALKLEHGDFKV